MRWNSSVSTKLRVAYAKLGPFVGVRETEEGDILEGFMPQILQMVARWMNLDLTLIREPFDTYGNWKNNSWTGMVGMLYRNEVDFILNPILPEEKFLDFLYYTNPITIESYTILSGKKSEEMGIFLYFSVLGKSVWLGILIALIVLAVTSAALYRRALLRRSFQWIGTIGEYSWNFLSCLLKQAPKEKFMLRNHESFLAVFLPILNMLWVFCIAFIVMNTFQSLLVSKLALRKTTPVADTLADLVKSHGVICIAPREIQIDHILRDSNLETNRLAWKKVNREISHAVVFDEDWLYKVEEGKYCVIHGHLIIKDRLSTFFRKVGMCNLHLSNVHFYPFSLMMAIHKKMPVSFFETFNLGITRLVDADITGKWFEAALEISNLCTSYSDNTLRPLGLQHIYGTLALWGVGLVTSFIVLLFETNILKCTRVRRNASEKVDIEASTNGRRKH